MEEEQQARRPLLEESNAYNIHVNGNNVNDGTAKWGGSATSVVVLSTLVAVSSTFCIGCATGYTSTAESGIREDLNLSVSAYSVFGSMLTVGGVIGAAMNGWLVDLIGRKGTMWFSQVFCIAGWLAIAFAENAWWLDIGRLLLGYAIGFICFVVPVYISEVTPKNLRGRFVSANMFMLCCGFSFAFFVGTIVSWRALALIGIVPCLFHSVGLFFVPESPRWLAKLGREKEFEAALQCLRGNNVDVSEEASEIKECTEAFEQQSKTRILDLFQRRYAHSLIVGAGLMILPQLGGCTGVTYYGSSILDDAGFSSSFGMKFIAVVQIPAVFVAVLLSDKLGRRPLLMTSAIGMSLCSLLLGLSFYFQDLNLFTDATPILVFIGVLGFLLSYGLGMGGIPWILISEIFPINVKGSAGSFVTLLNWSSSWIASYTFNYMFDWSSSGTFFVFCVVCGLIFVFTVKLVPETKGKTLEEIQASMTITA